MPGAGKRAGGQATHVVLQARVLQRSFPRIATAAGLLAWRPWCPAASLAAIAAVLLLVVYPLGGAAAWRHGCLLSRRCPGPGQPSRGSLLSPDGYGSYRPAGAGGLVDRWEAVSGPRSGERPSRAEVGVEISTAAAAAAAEEEEEGEGGAEKEEKSEVARCLLIPQAQRQAAVLSGRGLRICTCGPGRRVVLRSHRLPGRWFGGCRQDWRLLLKVGFLRSCIFLHSNGPIVPSFP